MIYRFKINLDEKILGKIKVLPIVFMDFKRYKNNDWQKFKNKRVEPEVISEILNDFFFEISSKDFYLELLKHTIAFNIWDFDNMQFDNKSENIVFNLIEESTFDYEKV